MRRKELRVVIARIDDGLLKGLLSGRSELRTLHAAFYAAPRESGQAQAQVLDLIDCILPGNWRDVAALPKTGE